MDECRKQFEEFMSKPPYEQDLRRYGPKSAWPDNYRQYPVELAWCAWQELWNRRAEPSVSDSELAQRILTALGYATELSMEPGADERRDRIAALIADRVCPRCAELSESINNRAREQAQKTVNNGVYLDKLATLEAELSGLRARYLRMESEDAATIALLRDENARLKAQAEGLQQINIENAKTLESEIERLERESSACDMLEEYRQDAQTTADALGHIQRQLEAVNQDRDDWIACHAKIFRELQDAQDTIAQQAAELKRINNVANCGTVDSWLSLSDEKKREWFAMTLHTDSEKAKIIKEQDYQLEQQAEQLAAAEKDAEKWKQMAEFQYAIRQYPNDLNLGTGALDAYFKGWNYDAAIAAGKEGKS